MKLTNSIVPYNPEWPNHFKQEAKRLRPIFGTALIELHHVGSTAVPELAAKPEIDLLVIVDASNLLQQWTTSLSNIDYKRGGDLQPQHHFFKRDVNGLRTHKLHLCRNGHQQIERLLKFRDCLRNCPQDRLDYQQLKLKLERENIEGIAEYLEGKRAFIDSILSKTGS